MQASMTINPGLTELINALLTAQKVAPVAVTLGGIQYMMTAGELIGTMINQPVPPPPVPAWVNSAQGVNVRSSPKIVASPSNVIAGLPNGTRVEMVGAVVPDGAGLDWQKVTFDGVTVKGGWVAAKYLTATPPVIVVQPPPPVTNKDRLIAPHFMGGLTINQIMAQSARHCTGYKVVDMPDALKLMHQDNPTAYCINRRYEHSDEEPSAYIAAHGGVDAAVEWWIQDNMQHLNDLPFAYHESFCEKGGQDPIYWAFEARRARRLAQMGRKACLLNIGAGKTSKAFWAGARDMVAASIEGGHLIGVHGYAQTLISDGYAGSAFGSDGQWHGELFPNVLSDDAWEAFRVVQDVHQLEAQGQGTVQMALTEFGLDDMVEANNGVHYPSEGKTRGWTTCLDAWRNRGWLNSTTPEKFYWRQLSYAAGIIGRLPQVKVITPYTYGNTEQWGTFNVAGVF